jgi:hypothetical protein
MIPPRWFYPLVAVCLVTLAGAVSWWAWTVDRYTLASHDGFLIVLDTRAGRVCNASSDSMICRDFSEPKGNPFRPTPGR